MTHKNNLTVLIKAGTTFHVKDGNLLLSQIVGLVQSVVFLRSQNFRVGLVTSGAVGLGCSHLCIPNRPTDNTVKQAIASVGQQRLMEVYRTLFSFLGHSIAPILLTADEFSSSSRYSLKKSFSHLFDLKQIPIFNEHDFICMGSKKAIGNNDELAAYLALLLNAHYLVILTDVQGLYTSDPRRNSTAKFIPQVDADELEKLITLGIGGASGSAWGTGGMETKLKAAKLAIQGGTTVAIASSAEQIPEIVDGKGICTRFLPKPIANIRN
ncbi:MAG: glutamate 5-kinase [Xenococcaceae cyanobacterium]